MTKLMSDQELIDEEDDDEEEVPHISSPNSNPKLSDQPISHDRHD